LALRFSGGVGDTRWSLAAGSLPAGLKLGERGVISGKAARAGQFRFTVVVTDSLGAKSAMTYTLRIARR
jgi:hypothetical protein